MTHVPARQTWRAALWAAATSCALTALPGTTLAAPTLVSASRNVVVGDSTQGDTPGPNSVSVAGGSFSDSISKNLGGISIGNPDFDRPAVPVQADQDSLIDLANGVITGIGHASVGFSAGANTGTHADSYMDVVFSLDGTYAWDVSGVLQADLDGGYATAVFLLEHVGGPMVSVRQAEAGTSPADVTDSGVLGAGDYHLWVFAHMGASNQPTVFGGSASFDFSLDLTPRGNVPEPAPLALLALALTGLVLRRARR